MGKLVIDGFTREEALQLMLVGLQTELAKTQHRILEIRHALKMAPNAEVVTMPPVPPVKCRISPEGRARIAAAQRRRWAAAKKASV